ncbi:gamma-glutamyltranspeptidase [Geopyxis carbonaria]|nr:gamma-glutamyltranspeptidase [Geopyxis carbonaria]
MSSPVRGTQKQKQKQKQTVHFVPSMTSASSTAPPSVHSATAKTPLLASSDKAAPDEKPDGVFCGFWRSGNVGMVASLLVLAFFFGTIVVKNKTRTLDDDAFMATGYHGVVSSDVDECSSIGVDVLQAGGNAVDAVIATGACIGTVNMFASGVGGGGFLVVRMSDGESTTFNFREMAPGAAHRDMYEHDYEAAKRGGLAVGVPGELHGLMTAHQHYGAHPWHELWAPSIDVATRGFQVSATFKRIMGGSEAFFEQNRPDWDFLFHNETEALVTVGDTIRRPEYAHTLAKIAGDGSGDGYGGVHDFYNGSMAAEFVATVQAAGGIITLADMANYFTAVTNTSRTVFHGHEVVTCPPPCSGHVLLEGLNIVEGLPMSDPHTLLPHHYLVEAMKHLSAGRTELGDPADPVVAANAARIAELISKPYAAALRANISAHTTYPWRHYNPRYGPNDPHGTSHISAIDAHGNAAALTTTVNLYWGARLHTPGGVIPNSQMDDFSLPGRSNAFNLRPSVFNYIQPGKRPLSSSAPTILAHPTGSVRLVLGASGGSRIVTGVFEAVVKNLLWGYGLVETVRSKRVHHQLVPDVLNTEQGVEDWIVRGLRGLGHEVVVNGAGEAGMSVLHAVGRSRRGGRVRGVADWWRKEGVARAY